MRPRQRLVSHVLLAAGVALVLTGMSAAQGWSTPGLVASVTAVAALLYVGAVWFGNGAPPEPGVDGMLVFDPELRVVSEPHRGRSVAAAFPVESRPVVEQACAAALAGEFTRFAVDGVQLSVVPVRASDGRVIFGLIASVTAVEAIRVARPV